MTGRSSSGSAFWQPGIRLSRRVALWPRPRLTLGAFLALFLASWLSLPVAAFAAAAPAPAFGLDISWPQCRSGIPTASAGQSLAIVGVTGGRAFSRNPCFGAEYLWAAAQSQSPALYINLNSPAQATAMYGVSGPRGTCQPNDGWCHAFNYGYNTAQDAVTYAQSAGARGSTWWLDVETANYWTGDTSANAQVIQGAIKYFQTHNLSVGIYSVNFMWTEIAGSYTPNLPIWVPRVHAAIPVMDYCSPAYSFGGGTTVLVQSWNGTFDIDYTCPNVTFSSGSSGALGASGSGSASGSASAPTPLTSSVNGILAGTEGGAAAYYTFPNAGTGSQQTVTLYFWPHGPDVASGVYVSLYQNGQSLAEVHASNATTPGDVTLSFSSHSATPFVVRVMNYTNAQQTPISYDLKRS